MNAKKREDRKKIASVEELNGVSDAQDRASAMLREYFSKNPPEQTELYRQNLALVKDRLMKPSAITEFNKPEGARYITISVPVLVLFLGAKDGHLKLSMMAASMVPIVNDARPIQTSENDISPSESHEAREIAQNVLGEVQRTRDLRPFYGATLTEPGSLEQALVDRLPALWVSPKTREEAGHDDLQQFYASWVNLTYLSLLYAISHYPADNIDGENLRIDHQLPADVRAMILKDEILATWWYQGQKDWGLRAESYIKKLSSINDVRSVSATLDRANVAMRDYFAKNPPEQMELYRQNVALPRFHVMEPTVVPATALRNFGIEDPKGAKYIQINLPVLVLVLVKKDAHLRLALVGPYLN
jgi:hypothetical protein